MRDFKDGVAYYMYNVGLRVAKVEKNTIKFHRVRTVEGVPKVSYSDLIVPIGRDHRATELGYLVDSLSTFCIGENVVVYLMNKDDYFTASVSGKDGSDTIISFTGKYYDPSDAVYIRPIEKENTVDCNLYKALVNGVPAIVSDRDNTYCSHLPTNTLRSFLSNEASDLIPSSPTWRCLRKNDKIVRVDIDMSEVENPLAIKKIVDFYVEGDESVVTVSASEDAAEVRLDIEDCSTFITNQDAIRLASAIVQAAGLVPSETTLIDNPESDE